MSKVYFMNNGSFDVSAMLTFGVSVKEGDDAIGYFGTGFKYAIAIILRLGGTITVDTCGDSFEFTAEKKVIRGKEFEIVRVNGVDAGFTTHLGAKWEPWQAYRELFCNCVDEGGEASTERLEFDTVICVDSSEIFEAYSNRSDYFISSKPIATVGSVEIHESGRPYYYYKGVAVAESVESVFSYNILYGVDLTEDRTAKFVDYDIASPISRSIQELSDKAVIRELLTSKLKGDKDRRYVKEHPSSGEFIGMCRTLINSDNSIPATAMSVVAYQDSKSGNWPLVELTSVQSSMIEKSVEFLRGIGIDNKYEIKVVKGLGGGCMGRAHKGVIYLSLIPFDLGTKQVASTILEEFVHLKYDCADFDRRMQSWLFDKVLSIGEEINGEPL